MSPLITYPYTPGHSAAHITLSHHHGGECVVLYLPLLPNPDNTLLSHVRRGSIVLENPPSSSQYGHNTLSKCVASHIIRLMSFIDQFTHPNTPLYGFQRRLCSCWVMLENGQNWYLYLKMYRNFTSIKSQALVVTVLKTQYLCYIVGQLFECQLYWPSHKLYYRTRKPLHCSISLAKWRDVLVPKSLLALLATSTLLQLEVGMHLGRHQSSFFPKPNKHDHILYK